MTKHGRHCLATAWCLGAHSCGCGCDGCTSERIRPGSVVATCIGTDATDLRLIHYPRAGTDVREDVGGAGGVG